VTESLFADECEPFFNSIGHSLRSHSGSGRPFVRYAPDSDHEAVSRHPA